MSIIQCTPVYAGAVGRAIRHVIRHARPHRIGHHTHPFRKLAHAAISKPAIIGYTCVAVGGGGALGTLGGGWGVGWHASDAGTWSEYRTATAGGGGVLPGLDTEVLATAPLSSLVPESFAYFDTPAPGGRSANGGTAAANNEHASVPLVSLMTSVPLMPMMPAPPRVPLMQPASGPERPVGHVAGQDATPVPEPGTLALLLAPVLITLARRRTK